MLCDVLKRESVEIGDCLVISENVMIRLGMLVRFLMILSCLVCLRDCMIMEFGSFLIVVFKRFKVFEGFFVILKWIKVV